MENYAEDTRLPIAAFHSSLVKGYQLTDDQVIDHLNPAIELHMCGHIDQAKQVIAQKSVLVQTAFDVWTEEYEAFQRRTAEIAKALAG